MKLRYLPAFAVLILVLAALAAYGQSMPDAYTNYNTNISPPQYVPSGAGAGPCATCQPAPTCQSAPACVGCGPVVTGYPASDCCNVAPMGTCGAFCAAGQAAPGWPYNWCSEYWLQPNSNF